MSAPVATARSRGRQHYRCARTPLSLAVLASLSLAAPVTVNSAETAGGASRIPDRATVGLRAGDGTAEGYLDLIIPAWQSDNALLFVNPRFGLKDEGAGEVNVGLGYRRLVAGGTAVIGANAYYDARFTSHNNQINQLGLGLEFLTENFDARVNWYDANNDLQLASFYETEQTSTTVSSHSSKSTEVIWGGLYGEQHQIKQNQTVNTTTRTTTTTTVTTTHQRFEQFEQGLDGYDAEIGFRLPLSRKAPQVKLFLGYYDYDNPLGKDIKGAKGRLEIKASNYLTLDAEVFENDELNGTDYFVGARLNVPFDLNRLAKGHNPFKHPNTSKADTTLRDRLNEQVMRDVRVQHDETGFEENEKARKVASTSSTSTSSSTSTTSGVVVIKDGVIFIDGDNAGTENGTAEHPWNTIGEGVTNAGIDGFIYIYEFNGGLGTYDEGVNLLNGQTITSSVTGNGGQSYTTATKPKITDSSQAAGTGVINLASGNTVNRFDVTARNCINCYGIENSASSSVATYITNNTITTSGQDGYGVWNSNNTAASTVSGNIITTSGEIGYGVLNAFNGAASTVSGNTITASGGNGAGVVNLGNYAASTVSGNTITTSGLLGSGVSNVQNPGTTTVSGNTITTSGDVGEGVYSYQNPGTTTVSGNTITTSGHGGYGVFNNQNNDTTTVSGNQVTTTQADAVRVVSNDANDCQNIQGNTLNAGGGNDAIEISGAAGIPKIQQTSSGDLAAQNTLVSGGVNVSAGTPTYNSTCP